MNLKKTIALLLVSALILSLGACKEKSPAPSEPDGVPSVGSVGGSADETPIVSGDAALPPMVGASGGSQDETPVVSDDDALPPVVDTPDDDALPPVVDAPDEGITLTMWCTAAENSPSLSSYEAAIKELEEINPNVTLNLESFDAESYKTRISAAASTNELPDIFFSWSAAFLGDYAESGKVYRLDDTYQAFKGELPESVLGNTTFDMHLYGVPMVMNILAVFSNMELLNEAGYEEVPGTYEDFIKCCDALRDKRIIPFGCSGKEPRYVSECLESIIVKTIGAEKMNNIFMGRATWDNEGVAAAVDTFQGLVTSGYFDPSGIGLSNDEVKQNFIDGKYAFYISGTWNCVEFADEARNPGFGKKVKVSEFPVIGSDKSGLHQLIGGPSDCLAVAASSPNAELAADYAFKLARLICHYEYASGNGLPAWTPYDDNNNVDFLTQTAAELCGKADAYVPFGYRAMNADEFSSYMGHVEMVYTCDIDGKDFTDGMSRDIR